MEYETEELTDIEVLKVKVSGTPGEDTRKVVHLKTLDAFNRSNYCKLLIDISSSEVPQNYTIINAIDLSAFLNKIKEKTFIKIAFLSTYEEKDQNDFKSLSQILAKRGQVKLFTNIDDANKK